MADDKRIIALLLDSLESAHIERIMLYMMIMTYRDHFPQIGDWESDLEALKAQQGPIAKKQFSALREAVARSSDLEKAIQQFLKDSDPKRPVH